MRPMRILSVMLTATLLAVASAGLAAAKAPAFRDDDDKLVLENDHVRVWFQGKKPMLKVFPAGADLDDDVTPESLPLGAGTGAFGYRFASLVEYNDLDGDRVADDSEVVASLDLDKASAWRVATSQEGDAVVLTLNLTAPVKIGKGNVGGQEIVLPDRDADVALVFTIRGSATTLDAAGVDVTVPATSIKYDLVVNAWPFANAELDRLALETRVTGALELDNATGVEGADVLSNGTAIGALSWTTIAAGTTAANETVDVPVRVAVASDIASGESIVVYTYDTAGLSSLVHDPTVGVMSTPAALQETGGASANPVPGAGTLLAVAAVGAVALALRRK